VKGKVFLTLVLVVVLLLTVTASAFARGGNVSTYRASLVELNGSGVTGMVAITMLPGQLKVSVWAYGTVPRKPHQQHIHGFADGSQATVPPPEADTNGDGFVSLAEAVPYSGPVLLALTPYRSAKRAGFIVFTRVYRGADLAKLNLGDVTINRRVVMIHGGYWAPVYGTMEYDEMLPVAAGRIVGPIGKSH
jgi:hypothetical protein